MNKQFTKRAAESGYDLKNSSPAAIEELLVSQVKDALGKWQNEVKVKPFLRIEDEDNDTSNSIKNAFGAMQLTAYGQKLYIPFIIAHKKLLPFDTIRMGEEEIKYDHAKLRRVVNAIEHKAKKKKEGGGSGKTFETMELADVNDYQANNGFLGTIMNIRDSHQSKNINGDTPWDGSSFGVMDDERLMGSHASEMDIMDGFHDVMEKIANIKKFTPQQMEAYEEHLIEKEAKAEEKSMEKAASVPDTMEAARVRRQMEKVAADRLFNVHRAASGNNIAFPTHENGRVAYKSGRVYHKFESLLKQSDHYQFDHLDALVLDNKGGYKILNRNQQFMASSTEPGYFELPTELARGAKAGKMYTFEKSEKILYTPFVVNSTYTNERVNDGIVVSVRERMEDGSRGQRNHNSLFSDVLYCKEVIKSTRKVEGPNFKEQADFDITISKDDNIKEVTYLNEEDMLQYIYEHAKDPQDIRLAQNMVRSLSETILVPADLAMFKMENNIEGYYTRPDGITTEGPFAKTAAYDDKNKARLTIKGQGNPKEYRLDWQYSQRADANGAEATKLEKRSVDNLTKAQAQRTLNELGFDYRTQEKFFQITDRNSRHAIFSLPDIEKAKNVATNDIATGRAKEKVKGVADAMLNSKNFMPIFEDNIAEGVARSVAHNAPSSTDKAKKLHDMFDWKQAATVAKEMEKVASDFDGAQWYETAALLNMKHQLDKIAYDIEQGNHIYNANDVFEKVASFQPVIEKKAKDLTLFNRQQLINTDKYLVKPSLVKEAMTQLDGLYAYADFGKKKVGQTKTAGIFREGKKLRELNKHLPELQKSVKSSRGAYGDANSQLRVLLEKGDKESIEKAMDLVRTREGEYSKATSGMSDFFKQRGEEVSKEGKRNVAIAGAIGLPGLAGASYGYESLKDKDNE